MTVADKVTAAASHFLRFPIVSYHYSKTKHTQFKVKSFNRAATPPSTQPSRLYSFMCTQHNAFFFYYEKWNGQILATQQKEKHHGRICSDFKPRDFSNASQKSRGFGGLYWNPNHRWSGDSSVMMDKTKGTRVIISDVLLACESFIFTRCRCKNVLQGQEAE